MRSTRCTLADLTQDFNYYYTSMERAPDNPTLRQLIRPPLIHAYNSASHEQFWSCLNGVIAQLREIETHNADLASKVAKCKELRDAFTYSSPEILIERFKLQGKLGQGSFGFVFRVHHIDTSLQLAMKEIDIPMMNYALKSKPKGYTAKCLERETSIGSEFYDRHLVHSFGSFQLNDRMYILMQEMKSSLEGIMKERGYRSFPKKEASKILKDICQGLSVLHENNIIHRDIKPANIFLAQDGTYKIGDFGFSVRSEENTNTLIGSLFYESPEMRKKQSYSFPIDIWAVGTISYQLLLCDEAFSVHTEAYNTFNSFFILRSGHERFAHLQQQEPEIFEFLAATLHPNANQRWTATQLLSSKLITNYADNAI